MPADDRVNIDRDVVFGLHGLSWHRRELDLDVDDSDRLGANVDIDETGVDGLRSVRAERAVRGLTL